MTPGVRQTTRPGRSIRRAALLFLATALSAAAAANSSPSLPDQPSQATDTDKVFVPFDPYDDSRREEVKAELYFEHGCSEETLDKILDSAKETGYIFSAKNVAAAFPSIHDTDKLTIGCAAPRLRMAFFSMSSANTVTARDISCDVQRDGLLCDQPVVSERYFVQLLTKTIRTTDNVSFDEALKIARWFSQDAGAQLSDEEKRSATNLAYRLDISLYDDVYTLRIGDKYCQCVFVVDLAQDPAAAPLEAFFVMNPPSVECPAHLRGPDPLQSPGPIDHDARVRLTARP